MPFQTTYWVILLVLSFIVMFILVPPKQGPELASFGFFMGLVQALVVLWLGQSYFHFFRAVGDPALFGIPMITSLVWIPLAILFAKFFPLEAGFLGKLIYILLFASGAALGQYTLSILDMWESIRWSPFYTFILAIVTHSLMTGFILLRHEKLRK